MYRAVGNRCAVDPRDLKINLSTEVILHKLIDLGFTQLSVNPVAVARERVGMTTYRRGARPDEAPVVVDCTSFIKWIYGQCGVWLPRYSVQQRLYGESIAEQNLAPGDVIFTTGYRNYFDVDPKEGVGHAGLFTEKGTVIHAANKRVGVVEEELTVFLSGTREFRRASRIFPLNQEVWCLEIPSNVWIETSDDVRWILLQRL